MYIFYFLYNLFVVVHHTVHYSFFLLTPYLENDFYSFMLFTYKNTTCFPLKINCPISLFDNINFLQLSILVYIFGLSQDKVFFPCVNSICFYFISFYSSLPVLSNGKKVKSILYKMYRSHLVLFPDLKNQLLNMVSKKF